MISYSSYTTIAKYFGEKSVHITHTLFIYKRKISLTIDKTMIFNTAGQIIKKTNDHFITY